MRVAISIFENYPQQIDAAMENLVGILLAEVQLAFSTSGVPKNYRSMVLQAVATAFYNNSAVTFGVLENNNFTGALFQNWLGFMPKFTLEFEIRRILFGLGCILKTNPDQIPQLVKDRLPSITK